MKDVVKGIIDGILAPMIDERPDMLKEDVAAIKHIRSSKALQAYWENAIDAELQAWLKAHEVK